MELEYFRESWWSESDKTRMAKLSELYLHRANIASSAATENTKDHWRKNRLRARENGRYI